MNITDAIYSSLLEDILKEGYALKTRNAEVVSHRQLPRVSFGVTPLISVRATAWRKAIREMAWFFSGERKCPEDLLDWWDGQLSPGGELVDGYSDQFRRSIYISPTGLASDFDQVKFILDGLRTSPNSRRLLLTVWNPGEMANITETNANPNTPTCCHSIVVQFFVREGQLFMTSYQRSADMLLGVPHNWIQSWAMLLYFAYHSGLEVGGMDWLFGDAHIYKEPSHYETALEIVTSVNRLLDEDFPLGEGNLTPTLTYQPKEVVLGLNSVPVFDVKDFKLVGLIDSPLVTARPKLL